MKKGSQNFFDCGGLFLLKKSLVKAKGGGGGSKNILDLPLDGVWARVYVMQKDLHTTQYLHIKIALRNHDFCPIMHSKFLTFVFLIESNFQHIVGDYL